MKIGPFLLLIVAHAAICHELQTVPAAEPAGVQQQRLSFAAQRISIKRQIGEKVYAATVAVSFDAPLPPLISPSGAACPALTRGEINDLADGAATIHDLAPDLIRAVMRQESGFRPCAVSVKGALGLMQLMPATVERFQVSDPFDPAQNVHAGAALLRKLLNRYGGDLSSALAAYNAGSVTADTADPANYPAETKAYVAAICSELGPSRCGAR